MAYRVQIKHDATLWNEGFEGAEFPRVEVFTESEEVANACVKVVEKQKAKNDFDRAFTVKVEQVDASERQRRIVEGSFPYHLFDGGPTGCSRPSDDLFEALDEFGHGPLNDVLTNIRPMIQPGDEAAFIDWVDEQLPDSWGWVPMDAEREVTKVLANGTSWAP